MDHRIIKAFYSGKYDQMTIMEFREFIKKLDLEKEEIESRKDEEPIIKQKILENIETDKK